MTVEDLVAGYLTSSARVLPDASMDLRTMACGYQGGADGGECSITAKSITG